MSRFAVALSGDFQNSDGSPALADFDLTPLTESTAVSVEYVQPLDGVMPASGLEGFDALILLQPRFGVGYDNVDLDACNAAGIAAVITPDGVRRAVAVTVMTSVLALAGKLMADSGSDALLRLCRKAKPRFSTRFAEGWFASSIGDTPSEIPG